MFYLNLVQIVDVFALVSNTETAEVPDYNAGVILRLQRILNNIAMHQEIPKVINCDQLKEKLPQSIAFKKEIKDD